ncbi:MAG: ribosome silencing factor [Bacteroides sp.]|nr:ribosome silencing factor [Bacteroides sp.]
MAKKKNIEPNWAACIADAMEEKKGGNILSMDLRGIPGASFDCFVVCEATSGPQVRAIADGIEEQMYLKFGIDPLHKEGYNNAEWVLLDFGGTVAHVFLDSVRQHYRLEELWGDSGIKHYKGGNE